MHYLLSSLHVYSILLDVVSDYHGTPPVKPYNTAPELWRLRALTISCEFFLSQRALPAGQPASAAASRRVLEPDILEVSHLCGWMYWKRVCTYLCLTSEYMIFSLKRNCILKAGWTVMHYPVSTLYCFSTLYLDCNHDRAGVCICLLMQSQIQCK